jgi:protoporphyrinogen oxidase
MLEKESTAGGLCRSFSTHGIAYDIGPHIFFSKNAEVLKFMNDLLEENIHTLRRSNHIIHKGKFVQYPFENDLFKLPENDLHFCINTFLNNPYENYPAENMLQFFLKTFGAGITNLYLRPYNEKIWKFDPAFMDTQMVERIPKPPKEDILRSAAGETVDGYLHQLYFTYPKRGGTEALISSLRQKLSDKVRIVTGCPVTGVRKLRGIFEVEAGGETFTADRLVSTIPANLLSTMYENADSEVGSAAAALRYNSIIIVVVNVKPDKTGDNFAFMTADSDIIFHRISKLDFLGKSYRLPDSCTYMAEITYRKGDLTDMSSNDEIMHKVTEGMKAVGFIDDVSDINFIDAARFEYAYVIYDISHRVNMNIILRYFNGQNVNLLGRFGSFEYMNMDAVIEQALQFSKNLTIYNL